MKVPFSLVLQYGYTNARNIMLGLIPGKTPPTKRRMCKHEFGALPRSAGPVMRDCWRAGQWQMQTVAGWARKSLLGQQTAPAKGICRHANIIRGEARAQRRKAA